MTFNDFTTDPNKITLLAGVAGAAAMAMFDIQRPLRAVQQLVIGSIVATFGTDALFPLVSWVLSVAQVPAEYHPDTAPFIVGASAMYVLEFIRAFWTRKVEDLHK